MVYAGAEHIISPLGDSAEINFQRLLEGDMATQKHEGIGNKGEDLYAAVIDEVGAFDLVAGIEKSIKASLALLNQEVLATSKKGLLLSTTKGEIEKLKEDAKGASLLNFKQKIEERFTDFDNCELISNACISGVLALIRGHDLIVAGEYETVVVSGADMLSEFTLAGFQSFFAIADDVCRPFDKNRTGINLGEGVGTIVLSSNPNLFQQKPMKLLGGSAANDANHISGPSRTGEGLYRSIHRTLKRAEVSADEIDFLSAHGTGTNYNDEMESIAFDRIGLNTVPMHSLKGALGHTFGAAGLIEAAICLQSMRNNVMLASAGFQEEGTSCSINVLQKNQNKELKTVLKTASGFGGCNASIVFRK